MRRHTNIIKNLWGIQFVRNVLTLQVGSFFKHGLGLLQSILFARLLGLDGWGIYAMALAFRGVFSLLTNYGQSQATGTFFAEKYAQKDKAGMQAVVRYYFLLSLLSIFVLGILAIIAPMLSQVFYNDTQIGLLSSIAFAGMIAGSFHTLFFIFLQVLRKIKLLTALENGSLLLQILLGISFLLLGFGPAGIFLGLFVGNILMQIVLIFCYLRIRHANELPGIRSSFFSGQSIKPFLKQGLWIAIHKNLANFLLPSTLFIMSFYAQHSTIGIARLAYSIGLLPSALLLSHATRMTQTVLPIVYAQGIGALKKNIAMLIKHTMVFHATLCFGSLFLIPFFVIVLYGWEFAGAIIPALWIVLISLMRGTFVANVTLFRIYRKSHIPALWHMVMLPLQLMILVIIIQITSPLNAFVLTVFIYHIGHLWLCWYLYRNIFQKGAPFSM